MGIFLLIALPAHAQKSHEFHEDDLEHLPKFYEEKVTYMKKILHIQDLATGLLTSTDPDIFYDYCEERLDADWSERKNLRKYADAQHKIAKPKHDIIERNQKNMSRVLVIQLHKKSGLKATDADELYNALKGEIYKSEKHTTEVKRRMLMHEMLWGISDCKKAIESVKATKVSKNEKSADATPEIPTEFYKKSLANYVSLVVEQDAASDALIKRLLREPKTPPKPAKAPSQKPESKTQNDG
jgi:hypothetical protein